MTSLNTIRTTFLDYFKSLGGDEAHEIVASSSVVPENDPTLLFTNAGMVQFKNVFMGKEKRPYKRAASAQKCIRAGGKHNDLDNVGYTARHHTFFEMLGNFSFGDYFKEKAIVYAWDLLTKVYQLPPERLLVTVYAQDDEAHALWKKVSGFSDDKIIRIPTSDNFWSMGDTGPCGPCSEIFYDHGENIAGGPPGSADEDGDRFVEIWNLVFMQFDQQNASERILLPKPSIDTGMGLERITAVLQGVHNNYEIDLFENLINAEIDKIGAKVTDSSIASYRVIADHLRSISFLLADGVTPSNEGRGYVLRRIMRRAMRHAHLLGAKRPVLHSLVAPLTKEMGDAYGELRRAQPMIEASLEQEEERFLRTLGRGMSLLDEAVARIEPGGELAGDVAFKLYDTYGFPLDLTEDALRSRNISVDVSGFEQAMAAQKAGGRANWKGSGDAGDAALWQEAIKETHAPTEFLGYEKETAEATLQVVINEGKMAAYAEAGDRIDLIFDRTPFYAESGGQVGDTGIVEFDSGALVQIDNTTKRPSGHFIHSGEVKKGKISVGDSACLRVDHARRQKIRANHSATHILHAALRHVLGPHVAQKGSMVSDERLRFDFTHGQPLSAEDIMRVEDEVNAVIRQNAVVSTEEMAPDEAIEAGAMALFGEKYGDRVRVLSMGHDFEDRAKPYSVELCGGTHAAQTGDIAVLKITTQAGVAAGVRRIEAVTGAAANAYIAHQEQLLAKSAACLKVAPETLPARIQSLVDERNALTRELKDMRRQLAMGGAGTQSGPASETINGTALIASAVSNIPAKELRTLVDAYKKELGSGIVAIAANNDGKGALAVGVTDDLTNRFSAVDIVRHGGAALGGKGGGGRADFAQAGGPDGAGAAKALDAIRDMLGQGSSRSEP